MLTLLTILGAIVGIITGLIAGEYSVYSFICRHNIDGEDIVNPSNNLNKSDQSQLTFVGIIMLAIGGLLMWAGISGHENTGALILVSLFAFFLGGLLTYAGVTGNAHKME